MKRSKVCRGLLYIFLFAVIMTCFSQVVRGESQGGKESKVLVIYSSKDGEVDEYQRTLDLLIGHFTTDITFKNATEVREEDLREVTHLFYYGQVAEELPNRFLELFDRYTGYFVVLGYNSEYLGDQFSFLNPLHEQVVDQLVFTNKSEKVLDIVPESIIDIEVQAGSEVLVAGKRKEEKTVYPIVIKHDKHYYFSFDSIDAVKKIVIGEIFHEIFQANHVEMHPAYMRLEDIHPLVDPQKVKDITEILKEKNIPFMMAVIPVYTNPETGKQHHFSDSPQLLKVLKEAQKNGGSVILHGYTHQFRESETGEGFEFWDVEHNTPIYAEADEKFILKKESDFPDKKAYEKYIRELKQFESDYIEAKLTRGIQELTNYGLFPLAFEAPHYTMSQNGYDVVSKYFSTYVGQIQLSDKDWEVMDTTPYVSTPSFLNGLEVLPETMGYVTPYDKEAVQKMLQRARSYEPTTDGVFGAFYHPYLGVERFKELIEEMEKLPDISWIDLQELDVWVKADNVGIFTENGEIVTDIKQGKLLLSSFDFPAYHLTRLVEFIVWVMAITGGGAVLVFIGFTLFLSTRKVEMEG